MSFVVAHVSHGNIGLTKCSQVVRVMGEWLLVPKPGEPAFVIYLNSINEIELNGEITPVRQVVRHK